MFRKRNSLIVVRFALATNGWNADCRRSMLIRQLEGASLGANLFVLDLQGRVGRGAGVCRGASAS